MGRSCSRRRGAWNPSPRGTDPVAHPSPGGGVLGGSKPPKGAWRGATSHEFGCRGGDLPQIGRGRASETPVWRPSRGYAGLIEARRLGRPLSAATALPLEMCPTVALTALARSTTRQSGCLAARSLRASIRSAGSGGREATGLWARTAATPPTVCNRATLRTRSRETWSALATDRSPASGPESAKSIWMYRWVSAGHLGRRRAAVSVSMSDEDSRIERRFIGSISAYHFPLQVKKSLPALGYGSLSAYHS